MRTFAPIALVLVFYGMLSGCGDNSQTPTTVGDHLRADNTLRSLRKALKETELLSELDGEGPFTVFAFETSDFDPLGLDPDALDRFASYHVHDGLITAEMLETTTAASTRQGTEVHIRNTLGGIALNDGALLERTITAENGVIHVLSHHLRRTLITTTEVFSNTDLIPIEGYAVVPFTIDTLGAIHSLALSLDIRTEEAASLHISLWHQQSGRFLTLKPAERGQGRDIRTTFTDSARFDVTDARYDGESEAFPESAYRPPIPLEIFVGAHITGNWSLFISNFASEAEGDVVEGARLIATIGTEAPAPALVLDPSSAPPPAMAQGFHEAVSPFVYRVGGLGGEVDLSVTVGDMASQPSRLAAEDSAGGVTIVLPEDAPLGEAPVRVIARAGDVSRVANYKTQIATAQRDGLRLASHLSLPELGAPGKTGSDVWGWTDPETGAEIAIMTTSASTVFVDVSDASAPVVLGILPTQTEEILWRDAKVYQNYAYIVSEASDHGMQIFDLRQLRDVTSPPQLFGATAHVSDFGNAHNIFINEESGLAYVVGTDFSGCDGGMLVYDLAVPEEPQAISCFSGGLSASQVDGASYPTDVYTHDVQCVVYAGPDSDYTGRELCFSSDEQTIAVADFSDPSAPQQIVRKTYQDAGYTHQGWLTEDHRYFIVNDEFDESTLSIPTRTYVWDLSDIDNPELLDPIENPSDAIGHNTYIADGVAYQANYTSGLRLVDVSDLAGGGEEFAFFDTNPNNDVGCSPTENPRCETRSYEGAWSNYPFFESGTILVSDTERGLFVLERE